MPDNEHDLDRDYLRELGYESQDVSLPAIGRAVVALFAFVAFAALLAWALFLVLVPRTAARRPAAPVAAVRRLPPAPRIQAHPAQDIRRFLAQEDAQLTTYGWIDQKAGVARIPVARAEDLVLERGLLPARAAPAAGAAAGR